MAREQTHSSPLERLVQVALVGVVLAVHRVAEHGGHELVNLNVRPGALRRRCQDPQWVSVVILVLDYNVHAVLCWAPSEPETLSRPTSLTLDLDKLNSALEASRATGDQLYCLCLALLVQQGFDEHLWLVALVLLSVEKALPEGSLR